MNTDTTLKEQLKIAEKEKINAERDKNIAEAQKAISEKKKIDFEFDRLEEDCKKTWYKRDFTRKWFEQLLVGVSILAIFITYVIEPLSFSENNYLKVQNSKDSINLYNAGLVLKANQTKLKMAEEKLQQEKKRFENYSDSSEKKIKYKEDLITATQNSKDSIIKYYQKLFSNFKDSTNVKYQNAISEINRLTKKEQDQKKEFEALNALGTVKLTFVDNLGQTISLINVSIRIYDLRQYTNEILVNLPLADRFSTQLRPGEYSGFLQYESGRFTKFNLNVKPNTILEMKILVNDENTEVKPNRPNRSYLLDKWDPAGIPADEPTSEPE